MLFSKLFHIQRGITSLIGSGGKTTAMAILAKELRPKGRVLLTTTTHILSIENYPIINTYRKNLSEILSAFQHQKEQDIIVLGEWNTDKKKEKLSAPSIELSLLLPYFDYILVEADGSKRLPLKAHADYEPVIPPKNTQTIGIVGASGFFQRADQVCHRLPLFQEILRSKGIFLNSEGMITPSMVATVLECERLCDQVFVNQMDLICKDKTKEMIFEFKKHLSIPTYFGSFLDHFLIE